MNTIWIFLIVLIVLLSLNISKFINYENFKIFKLLKYLKNSNKKGLYMTLGTKIGVGSIIGTTMAIYIGGSGSVFWIIVFSILSSSLIYYESYLGSYYKEKISNTYLSGPYFYIKKGLNNNILALLTMVLLIICYSFIFQMIQTNTITNILKIILNMNKYLIAFVLLIILIFFIFFSVNDLVNIMNKLVPIMCSIYIIIGLYSLIIHYNELLKIFALIIKDAFNIKSFLSGFLIGIKRAVFLNEIMIGTTSISSGIDNSDPKDCARVQTISLYFITFIISLITSLLVIIFKNNNVININNYNELIVKVFSYHYNTIGPYILIIIILLFSLTTIVSGYYIGISNLMVITKNKNIILFFRIFMLLFCISGIFIKSNIIWSIIDYLMYVLILINIYSLYKIRSKYDRKRLG